MATILTEIMHENSDFSYIFRSIFMIIGALVFSTLSVNIKNQNSIFLALIYAGLLLTVFNTFTFINILSGVSINSISESTYIKNVIFGEQVYLKDNLNNMGYNLSLFNIAILNYYYRSKSVKKISLLMLGLVFSLGIVVTLSRSAILVFVISVLIFLKKNDKIFKSLPILVVATLLLYVIIPDIAINRLTGTVKLIDESSAIDDVKDSRFKLISSTLHHFSAAMPFGVGHGNYFGDWGINSRFYKYKTARVHGTHNLFIQIYFFFGMPSLIIFILCLLIIFIELRSFAVYENNFFPYTVLIFLILMSFFNHNLYNKIYSLCFGIIYANLFKSKYGLKI
tara:strand:+ start:117 stop:1130 length:1014 start_codon:yes stop_codon:yes gene_type:complete